MRWLIHLSTFYYLFAMRRYVDYFPLVFYWHFLDKYISTKSNHLWRTVVFLYTLLGNVYYYFGFLVLLLNINSQNIWFIPLIYFNGLFLKASTRKLYGCCEQLLLLLQMTSNAVPSVRDTSWFDHRVFPVLVFIWLRTLPCCLSLHTNKRSKGESVVLNTSPLHDSFKSLSQKQI